VTAFPAWWAFCQRPENDGQPLHDDPGDPGGATCWGFTFATWRADAPRLGLDPTFATFRGLTQARIAPVARAFCWNAILAELMPEPVAAIWADFNFTSGGGTACSQRVLQVEPGVVRAGLRVEPDGVVGTEQTIPAIAAAWADDPPGLLDRLTAARIAYYASLGMAEFLRGWTRRANDGLALARILAAAREPRIAPAAAVRGG